MINTKRKYNRKLLLLFKLKKKIYTKLIIKAVTDTIEFCVPGLKKPVFQTCEKEKGKVVFQLVKKIRLTQQIEKFF